MRLLVIIFAILGFSMAQQMITNGVPCVDVKTIVDKHNDLRMLVASGTLPGQPKASDMRKLAWDNKLQKLAQDWANRMTFQHNPNRFDERFYVGENLYMSWSSSTGTASNWNAAIQAWFDEYKLYTYGPIGNVQQTGHYTQVVWANTMYVGCGYTVFSQNGSTYKLYVCNYGPGGNYIGQYPYQTGSGCNNLCCTTQCNNIYGDNCRMSSFLDLVHGLQ